MANHFSFGLADLNKELEDEFAPGEELDEEDFEGLKAEVPKRPSFPIITLAFAILTDFGSIISLGTLSLILTPIGWIVIRLYLFRKVGFIKKWLYRRYIFSIIIEIFSLGMFPQWTIFVLRAHAKERKNIDQVLTAIEKLIIRSATGGGLKSKALERFI